MIELAWLWQRTNDSAESLVQERVGAERGRRRALHRGMARKLLVALWRFVTKV